MRKRLLDDLHAGRNDIVAVNLLDVASSGRFETRTLCLEHCVMIIDDVLMTSAGVFDKWSHFVDRVWLLPLKGMAMRDRFDQILLARGLFFPSRLIEISLPTLIEHLVEACDVAALMAVSLLSEAQLFRLPVLEGGTAGDDFYMEHGIAWARGGRLSPAAQYALSIMSTLP